MNEISIAFRCGFENDSKSGLFFGISLELLFEVELDKSVLVELELGR